MTNIKGFFETKWDKTQGICIKDQATDNKGEWYGGKLVWKFVNFNRGDPIIYELDETGKNLKFIKSDITEQINPEPQEFAKDDTVIWNKLIDISDIQENIENMLGGLIEDVELIKKHFGIKRETA